MSPVPGAPTATRPANRPGQSAPPNNNQPAVARIPFTRAARKKSRSIYQVSGTLSSSVQQLNPIQIPANGFLRKVILQFEIASAGNSATVAFQNDAPFIAISQLQLQAANGDQLYSPIDGFDCYAINKYGCFSNQGYDPITDPSYSKVTGSGGTGGTAFFSLDVPLEFDARDGSGSLPNMAANQSYLLQLWVNTLSAIYSTSPTNAPTFTLTVLAEYWAAPAATNPQGVPQETAPVTNGLVGLIQTETPPITPSTDQPIQLTNVGNTIRWWILTLRDSSGVRTESNWPNVVQLSVNNDQWRYQQKAEWRKKMAREYGYTSGITATPTAGNLDNGVFVFTEFMNDGAQGDGRVSGASNRDLLLVTGSATAVGMEFQNWGSGASALKILTHSLKIPSTAAFYHPFGI